MVMGLFLYLPSLLKPTHAILQAADTTWLHQLWQNNGKDTVALHLAIQENDIQKNAFTAPVKLFYFDPNAASHQTLMQLGLTAKNAQTILNYRQKGGRFKSAEDLLKIWGIKRSLAIALMPYVQIKANNFGPNLSVSNQRSGFNQPYTPKPIPTIQMESATQTEWELLPGIGPVLAQRILKYRDRIGGFSDKTDLLKVYGISDSLFQIIQPYLTIQAVGKPSINTSNAAMLVKAGVPLAIAQAIVQYRLQYGAYQSLEDLKRIVFIQPAQYQQLLDLVKL